LTRQDVTFTDEELDAALVELAKENEAKDFIAKKAKKKASEEAARAKAVGTVTISNDPKLNITTGIDKLKNLQNIVQEKNMANELDVTEVDIIKNEKIQRQKKEREDTLAAIAIAADLKGDIQAIKRDLCEGPGCLKEQVQNKFGEIDAKIAKLDAKSVEFYSCDKCSYPNVPALSSFCPQCGAKIPSWTTDEGVPVPGWVPYYESHKEEE